MRLIQPTCARVARVSAHTCVVIAIFDDVDEFLQSLMFVYICQNFLRIPSTQSCFTCPM